MSFSKWIGAGLGWSFGGPIGAIIGLVLGSIIDSVSDSGTPLLGLADQAEKSANVQKTSATANAARRF